MKKIISMVLCSAMALTCFASCGKESKYIGRWECESMEAAGTKLSGEVMGVPIAGMMQIEIKDDNKATVTAMGEEQKATWELDDDTLILDVEGDSEDKTEFKLEDDKLISTEEEDGVKAEIILVKVDEFTEIDTSELLAE